MELRTAERSSEGAAVEPDAMPTFERAPETLQEPLITAEQAYPALEELALSAKRELLLGFRVLDPRTKLIGPGRAHGSTWFDLLRHRLSEGVRVRMLLSDFDPLGRIDLHHSAWEAIDRFRTLEAHGDLQILPALHPATIVGAAKFWAMIPALLMLRKRIRSLNELHEDERQTRYGGMPGLWRPVLLKDGRLGWRFGKIPRVTPATLHQKIAIADNARAIVGGIDIDDRRYDTWTHDQPAADTWYDVSVGVNGDIAVDATRHFAEVWNSLRLRMNRLRKRQWRYAPAHANEFPGQVDRLELPAKPDPDPRIRFVRTVSRRGSGLPIPRLSEIESAHIELIGEAKKLIYIETQFFRSRNIARALARAARANPQLRLILILPAAPEDVAFLNRKGLPERFGDHMQARCLDKVLKAFGDRAAVLSPARPVPAEPGADPQATLHGAEIIYVHAKLLIIDRDASIVSSANLNGRSLRWDTEAGVVCYDGPSVERLRDELFAHWHGRERPAEADDLDKASEFWWSAAVAEAERRPQDRTGFLLPHDIERARQFGLSVPGVPEEFV